MLVVCLLFCVVTFILLAVYSRKWRTNMAKLKLKLDDFEYIEGTPEELAAFIKIVGKQPSTEKELRNKDTSEDTTSVTSLLKGLEDVEVVDLLPNQEDVINFITSKEMFEHNTIELQEKFLGKRFPVREDPKLYTAFDNIIRKARKHITEKYNGVWDNRATKSYGRRTHVTIYRFKKSTDESESNDSIKLSDSSNNISVPKLSDFKKVEPAII